MRRLFTLASVLSLILCLSLVCCAVVQHHYDSYCELLDIRLPAPINEALFLWHGPTDSLHVLWHPVIPGQFGPSRGKGMRIPGWIVLGTLSSLPIVRVVLLARDRNYRRRLRIGYCRACFYDLTGNTSGVCPECGTPVHSNPVRNQKSGISS